MLLTPLNSTTVPAAALDVLRRSAVRNVSIFGRSKRLSRIARVDDSQGVLSPPPQSCSYFHQQVRSSRQQLRTLQLLRQSFSTASGSKTQLGPMICSPKNERVTEHLNPVTLVSQLHLLYIWVYASLVLACWSHLMIYDIYINSYLWARYPLYPFLSVVPVTLMTDDSFIEFVGCTFGQLLSSHHGHRRWLSVIHNFHPLSLPWHVKVDISPSRAALLPDQTPSTSIPSFPHHLPACQKLDMHTIIDSILSDLFGDASGSGLVTIKDLQEKHRSISGEGYDDCCNLLVQQNKKLYGNCPTV
jgi:hypothetical protein